AGIHFIELFHGPTLAFKDMALTMLPHLLKIAARKMKNTNEIVILTATSGDTGKAALESFSDVNGTKIIVFYPRDGVSKIQERQMITQEGSNTHVIAIEG
ncbi:MAG TPA: threonine synthase, partial [Actinobacteria bacterium]|nr:threonine synthase [Actinomycetota bacterium]